MTASSRPDRNEMGEGGKVTGRHLSVVEGRRDGWKLFQARLPNSNKSDSGMLHTHVPCTKLFS